MFSRRETLPLGAVLAAFATAGAIKPANAKTADVKIDPFNQSSEMEAMHAIRLPKLDQQSYVDFLGSVRIQMGREFRNLSQEIDEFAVSKGIDPKSDVTLEEAFNIASEHPGFAMDTRAWVSDQEQMWQRIAEIFEQDMDQILAELEKADNAGPGTLELDPNLDVPDWARHEIHIQPGGYVGHPFAGAIAQYGSKQFGRGSPRLHNDLQERHLRMAQEAPLPQHGDVKRVLDMGTGWGSLATSMKLRFPESEVWGIDVGAPMVRWAHYRAAKMGVDVNFAQRLAQDTKFEDNSFDIVISYIMHHETRPDTHEPILAEALRILRPGGVYKPIDFVTKGNPRYTERSGIYTKARIYRDHRWNNEIWSPQYRDTDMPELFRKVGFTDLHVSATRGFQDLYGYKPA
jgi:ubiquinone/menaquinone biosynthesis C-methylase UbiE